MIAVTGANGLLGSFVVRKLLDQGEPFVALCRKGSDRSALNDVASKVSWRIADIMNPVELREALQDITHVIHTAASVSFNPLRADEVTDINVIGTRNVVNICLDQHVKRLVHVSSVAALSRQRDQMIIDETNKWIESPTNNVYASSKYQSELEVFRGQEEGLSTVVINPSFILGEGNWNVSSMQLFKYAWEQHPFYIDGFLNYVDVKDVASIIIALLHDPVEGERYIASTGKISFRDMLEKMATRFSKKVPSIKITKGVLKPLAFVESVRTRLTRTEPRITYETARLAGTEFLFDNRKITNKLDFEFQPIDETLERCCRYYIQRVNSKK
ncbi:MAG: NAD-dependent epimerase/dehydratase family protein [Chryseolinea sp.]